MTDDVRRYNRQFILKRARKAPDPLWAAASELGRAMARGAADIEDAEHVIGILERNMPSEGRGDRVALLLQHAKAVAESWADRMEADRCDVRARISRMIGARPAADIIREAVNLPSWSVLSAAEAFLVAREEMATAVRRARSRVRGR